MNSDLIFYISHIFMTGDSIFISSAQDFLTLELYMQLST